MIPTPRLGAGDVITGVPSEFVPTVWPKVRGLVKKGIDLDRFAPDDVLRAIRAKKMQLWLIGAADKLEAIVVTEINVYPRGTACGIVIVAGAQREAWMDHLADIEAWARSQGCQWIESHARKGWTREPALKDWRVTAVVMHKALLAPSQQVAA